MRITKTDGGSVAGAGREKVQQTTVTKECATTNRSLTAEGKSCYLLAVIGRPLIP